MGVDVLGRLGFVCVQLPTCRGVGEELRSQLPFHAGVPPQGEHGGGRGGFAVLDLTVSRLLLWCTLSRPSDGSGLTDECFIVQRDPRHK